VLPVLPDSIAYLKPLLIRHDTAPSRLTYLPPVLI
jgi:hypothetical protein